MKKKFSNKLGLTGKKSPPSPGGGPGGGPGCPSSSSSSSSSTTAAYPDAACAGGISHNNGHFNLPQAGTAAMSMSMATAVAGGGGGIGIINHNRMDLAADDSMRSGSSGSSLPPKMKPSSSHDYMLTSECGVWRVTLSL